MRLFIPTGLLFFIFLNFCPYVSAITLALKVSPLSFSMMDNGNPVSAVKKEKGWAFFEVEPGEHYFQLFSQGYKDYSFLMDLKSDDALDISMSRWESSLFLKKKISVGSQPKSVTAFDDHLIIPLLNDKGVQLYDYTKDQIQWLEIPPKWSSAKGFVESGILSNRGEIWASQMTTNAIHRWSWPAGTYLGQVDTEGQWSKVICVNEPAGHVYVTNWLSKDLSVISIQQNKAIKSIKLPGIPRGMALTPDEKFLYVTIYEPGGLAKIDLTSLALIKHFSFGYGALRHMVFDTKRSQFLISDMWRGEVLVVSYPQEKLIKRISVGPKVNTIALGPNSRYLYVSTRGPNNPETYLKEGYEKGKISVIDLDLLEVVDWQWAGDQPTGLCVYNKADSVFITNFLDKDVWEYSLLP